jgi:probable phosphoglycerate mutase
VVLVTGTQGTKQGAGIYHQPRFQLTPDATEVILVRHGQSAPYVEGTSFALVGGQGDPPLSTLGQAQAQRVCERLGSDAVAALYVTTLTRTAQTATPLAERLGLGLIVEERLREVYLGEWEGGLFRKMVADGHPTALRMTAEERWDVIPGAEPGAGFADRVRSALTDIAARHPGQSVAVFTHGGVIGQSLALATASRPFAFVGAENGSISRLVVAPERWLVRSYNDTAHLDGLA